MTSIYELITLKPQNEHDLEHDLEHKAPFSSPKIFDANGDLSKRWYVYFSYRNPETGKLVRMKNIYGTANGYKTKADRYSVLNLYRKRLLNFLKAGYNPFEDNTDFHQQQLAKTEHDSEQVSEHVKKAPPKPKPKPEAKPKPAKPLGMQIHKAFQKALELKKNVVGEKTLEDYTGRIGNFEKWLKKHDKSIKTVNQLDKKTVVEFLNAMQLRSSARTRNNYRTILSSIFQVLEDNDILKQNFIKQIKPLRTKPKRHKTYSIKEQEDIFKYLETHDPTLLLYIKFISYNFLRPIEVCRLKVKDLNIVEKTLQVNAKNKHNKIKIIPDILLEELPDLSGMRGEDFLFTPDGIGKPWKATLLNRRDHFSKRYKTVKAHFGLGHNHTMYSFRHTFITKVYRALSKDYSPYEAKSRLMQITGHMTMVALEKYLRDIDAELPEDYSNLLKT